jgi:hypothetical protein
VSTSSNCHRSITIFWSLFPPIDCDFISHIRPGLLNTLEKVSRFSQDRETIVSHFLAFLKPQISLQIKNFHTSALSLCYSFFFQNQDKRFNLYFFPLKSWWNTLYLFWPTLSPLSLLPFSSTFFLKYTGNSLFDDSQASSSAYVSI